MKETLREEILQYLQDNPKGNRKKNDIVEGLNIKSRTDQAILNKELEEMLAQSVLFLTVSGQYNTREQANVFEGVLSVNRHGTGFIDLPNGDSFRITQGNLKYAMDGDTVLAVKQPWETEGVVLSVVKHAKTHLIGTYYDNGHGLHLRLDDEKLESFLLKVNCDPSFTPVNGLKVQCEIEKYGNPMTLRVVQALGHKDDPGVDILAVLLEHGIESEFPDSVMEQANALPAEVSEEEIVGRTDLRDEITITIDGDDSKDFDDAVSVYKEDNGWCLKVSIADVSHYVEEGTPLDIEAMKRGCSTYVTDRVVPMLPHVLSNGICSLNPHVDRLTLTCEMHILPNGSTDDYRIYPSVIHSDERMTYGNVNRIYDGNEELIESYHHIYEMLCDLRDCADAIRRQRKEKGAIDFASDESQITVDSNGKPIDVHAKARGHAEEIIEDCMIAANVAVADFVRWQEIPAIYRIHEEPSARRLRNFINVSEILGHKLKVGKSTVYPNEISRYLESIQDTDVYPVLSSLLLRCMQKAKYDNRCVGHFGLAEEEYLHFTSPIRRYPDLIVHRMIRRYSFEGNTDLQRREEDDRFCYEAAELSSMHERNSQDAEYACDDMKKAEFMMDHIGLKAEGIISGITAYGIYVKLENTVEGMVPVHSLQDDFYSFIPERMELLGQRSRCIYRLGMKVNVIVSSADKDEKTVSLLFVGKNGQIQKRVKTRSRSTKKGNGSVKERRRYGRKKRK